MSEVRIRPAASEDIPLVAEVHVQAFAGFVLTKIGPGFLRRYYRTVLDYPGGILLVAQRDDRVVGFAAGFVEPVGFSRRLRRQVLSLAPHIVGGVLRHPELIGIVAQNAMGVFRGRAVGYEPTPGDAEFSSMAVLPSAQRLGVGRRLASGFVEAVCNQGAPAVYLTTDAEDNDHANRLYRSLGFVLQASYRASGGRKRNHYRLALG